MIDLTVHGAEGLTCPETFGPANCCTCSYASNPQKHRQLRTSLRLKLQYRVFIRLYIYIYIYASGLH